MAEQGCVRCALANASKAVYAQFTKGAFIAARVSFGTSFNSKQQKLEPKLVSALSETKRLFRLFRFYTETEIFDVSIERKRTEDQPKQFDKEHIFLFISENLEFFRFSVFSVCFETGVTYLYFNICTRIRAFYIFFLFTTIFNVR
jgi:hypothetical protein